LFQILYTEEAKAKLEEIANTDPKSPRIIFDHLNKLPQIYRTDPFLKGSYFQGLRRNRIGRYRAIYRVLEKERAIRIITLEHWKSVYDR